MYIRYKYPIFHAQNAEVTDGYNLRNRTTASSVLEDLANTSKELSMHLGDSDPLNDALGKDLPAVVSKAGQTLASSRLEGVKDKEWKVENPAAHQQLQSSTSINRGAVG